jgi:hypothetical protein
MGTNIMNHDIRLIAFPFFADSMMAEFQKCPGEKRDEFGE